MGGDDLPAWLALAVLRLRPGGARIRRALAGGISPELAREPGGLLRSLGLGADARREGARVAARCRRDGVEVLVPGDPRYPAGLARGADPPAALFVRGDPDLLAAGGAVVAGSRRVRPAATRFARRAGNVLGAAGEGVVAGFSSPVERAALAGCLAARGRAIAVHPYALDTPAGAAGPELLVGVLSGGALVSRVPPGMHLGRAAFDARHALMVGLATRVLVVEAGKPSGVLRLARHALDAGVEVLAGPGGPGEGEGSRGLRGEGAPEIAHPLDLVDPSGAMRELLPGEVRALEAVTPCAPDRALRLLGSGGADLLMTLERRGWITWTSDGRVALGYAWLLGDGPAARVEVGSRGLPAEGAGSLRAAGSS